MSVEWIVSSSGLIVLVLLVRFLFKKKFSPCLVYALWLVAALRLLLPVSISGTAVSILNFLPQQNMEWEEKSIKTGQIIYEQNGGSGGIMEEFGMAPGTAENIIIAKNEEAGEQDVRNTEAHDTVVERHTIKAEDGEAAKDLPEWWEGFLAGVKGLFTKENKIDVSMALRFCWLIGAGVFGCVFFAVNLDYGRRLRRGREKIDQEVLPAMSAIPVYKSQMIQTPCLFGLLAPAVYVMADTVKEEKTLRFVLCHENTHYRQRDHWWALVRIVCLCVHWFNPLVWVAACLSRQDGEMACDEKTVRMLGDKVRVDYGKALLELSAEKGSHLNGWRISTTMSGSAKQMKERLWMIVNMPVRTVGRQILVLVLAMLLAVVTFTGKSRAQESGESDTGNKEEVSIDIEHPGSAQVESPPEDSKTEGTTEIEFYREIVPVAIGGDEYELWCEGHTTEYGFYAIDTINLVDPEKPDEYVDTIVTEEISRIYWNTPEDQEAFAVESVSRDGGILTVDLNFDGWNDLCFQGWQANANIPYYCMLWNPEKNQYEYSAKICNVEVDEEEQWIIEGTRDGGGQYSTTYYRYDEYGQLHMVRYKEENFSPNAVFEQLDLTYVEDEASVYMLPAIVDGSELHSTLAAMAKQALIELYDWTGEKVDTACFMVSNMGDVFFGLTEEDVKHSRTFYSRAFGTDTVYNLSGYDKCISSMYISSGRSVWYSPVFWHVLPDRIDGMTDEEIIIWYLERVPLVDGCKVKSVEKRYEDMWTVQTESGVWFEVVYDVNLREISMVTGPYPDYPMH